MAGSASNWFKPSRGVYKGRAVYLSKGQQALLGGRSQAEKVLSLVTGAGRGGPAARQAFLLVDQLRPQAAGLSGSPTLRAQKLATPRIPQIAGSRARHDPETALDLWGQALSDSHRGVRVLDDYDDVWSGDHDLYAMTQVQGFHGRPKTVTRAELDTLVASGSEELWRGVTSTDNDSGETRTGIELARMFREGGYYAGYGMYGGGTYFASAKDSDDPKAAFQVARDYARGRDGGLVRAVLDPAAKIADYTQLRRDAAAWRTAEAGRLRAMVVAGKIDTATEARQLGQVYQVTDELSAYAAMRGYDAVRVPRGSDTGGVSNTSEPAQLIVLNRSVVITENTDRPAKG